MWWHRPVILALEDQRIASPGQPEHHSETLKREGGGEKEDKRNFDFNPGPVVNTYKPRILKAKYSSNVRRSGRVKLSISPPTPPWTLSEGRNSVTFLLGSQMEESVFRACWRNTEACWLWPSSNWSFLTGSCPSSPYVSWIGQDLLDGAIIFWNCTWCHTSQVGKWAVKRKHRFPVSYSRDPPARIFLVPEGNQYWLHPPPDPYIVSLCYQKRMPPFYWMSVPFFLGRLHFLILSPASWSPLLPWWSNDFSALCRSVSGILISTTLSGTGPQIHN